MKISEKIAMLEGLRARLRAPKFRQSKQERSDVIGELAGLLSGDGLQDGMMQAGHVFSVDGLSSARYESTHRQVDIAVTAALTRLKTGSAPKEGGTGEKVFIGHGRSPLWRELKDFVAGRLGLPWEEFNRVPVAGQSNKERLSAMLDGACFAFLILTAEDQRPDGAFQPRLNVVHEAGLFQGHLGFERAIIVLEEGCEEFSNVEGLGQIRFPKGRISACFEEIRAVLEREGIIAP
jgi:predicted nucleotide-binding protein